MGTPASGTRTGANLHADLELIRAGYQAKLRALETIWLNSAEDDGEAPTKAPDETVETVETVPSETVPSETVANETPAGGPVRAVWRGDARSDVEAVLPDLPELFDKRDVFQALGYEVPRATLYCIVDNLQMEKKIASPSHGGRRTQYRKVAEP